MRKLLAATVPGTQLSAGLQLTLRMLLGAGKKQTTLSQSGSAVRSSTRASPRGRGRVRPACLLVYMAATAHGKHRPGRRQVALISNEYEGFQLFMQDLQAPPEFMQIQHELLDCFLSIANQGDPPFHLLSCAMDNNLKLLLFIDPRSLQHTACLRALP